MPYTGTPRTWVAGEVVTAANLNANLRDLGRGFTDAWTSYTPTLTASTTNPTNWTQTGYYCQVGKLVVAKFRVTAGASMTAGSGLYRIALPVSANYALGDHEIGALQLVGTGQAIGTAYLANTAYIQIAYPTSFTAVNSVSNAAPWTWANTHFIRGQITYEAA